MGFKAPRAARWLLGAAWAARTMLASEARAASLQAHAAVRGEAIEVAEIRSEGGRWRTVAWSDLAGTALEPGRYEVRVRTSGAAVDKALEIPVCAGRDRVTLDARAVRVPDAGPVVLTLTPGAHDARIAVVGISVDVLAHNKAYIPGGVSSTNRVIDPVISFVRGEGAHIWDVHGKRYIDYVGSWGPMIVGHNHPVVREAVERAIRHGLSFGTPCAAEVIVCKRMAKLLDVPQPAQPLLNIFFGSIALFRRQDFIGLFFEHVDDELVDRFVSGCIRTLLHLLEQFAFNLYFV